MAYSLETSSVKTIVPGAEVSGFADVVARQAIANLPTLSGGEGVQIVNENGKNRIDLGLSAGSNMSFVYDQDTNTIRLDSEGGNYSGDDPIYVNNETNHIGITGESLSAGPNIDIFASGGYVVISANGGAGSQYTGISPIDVNNTTHQISAKGVQFGVQSPLYFVQDDNEAVVIGCSAGGTTYTGDAQGALDEVYANSGVWLTAHQDLSNYYTTAEANSLSSMLSGAINYVSANAGTTGQYVPLASAQAVYGDGEEGSYYEFNAATYSSYWEYTGNGVKEYTTAEVSPDGFAINENIYKLSNNNILSSTTSMLDRTLILKTSGANGRVDYVGIGALYHPGLMRRDRFAFMELASNRDGGYISAVRISNKAVNLYHFTSENAYEAGPGATWEQIVNAATATNSFPASANEAITAYQTNSANYLTAVDLTPYQTTADMSGYVSISDYNNATARIAELEQVLQTYSGQWLLPNEGEE